MPQKSTWGRKIQMP